MTPNDILRKAQEALTESLKAKKEARDFMDSIGPAILSALKPSIEEMAAHSKTTQEEILKSISNIKVTVPDIRVPESIVKVEIPEIQVPAPIVNITVPPIEMPDFPEIKLPKIVVPKPEVTINPKFNIPDIHMPDEMEIKGWINIMGYDRGLLSNPLPVQLRDAKGNPLNLLDNLTQIINTGGGGGGARRIKITNTSAEAVPVTGNFSVSFAGSTLAAIPTNNEGLSYNSDNPMPVYLTSGGGGSTAAALIDSSGVQYSGSNPLPVQILSGAGATSAVVLVDELGNQITKREDDAHSSSDEGIMSLAVRNDTGAILAGSDGDYVPLSTDSTGALRVDLNGTVSSYNSTTATLLAAAAFTGLTEDALNYNEIRISVLADQASATDGLSLQQSSDGSNWDITDVFSVPASTGKTFSVPRQARYFRAVYTNGGTNQGAFRISTILNRLSAKSSSQRPNDGYTNETDLEQMQNFLMLLNPAGTWDRARNGTGESVGALRVVHSTDSISSVSVQGSLSSAVTVGSVVSDAIDDGSAPVKVGGIARTANPSAVSGGDSVSFSADKMGRQLTRNIQVRELLSTAYATLTNGSETTLAAAVAGSYLDLIYIMGSNSSDAAVVVDLRAVTGGNIAMSITIPANGTAGVSLPIPYPQNDTGNNWTADMPDITGTTVYLSALLSKEL